MNFQNQTPSSNIEVLLLTSMSPCVHLCEVLLGLGGGLSLLGQGGGLAHPDVQLGRVHERHGVALAATSTTQNDIVA